MLREFAWITKCVLCSGLPRQLLWLCLGHSLVWSQQKSDCARKGAQVRIQADGLMCWLDWVGGFAGGTQNAH